MPAIIVLVFMVNLFHQRLSFQKLGYTQCLKYSLYIFSELQTCFLEFSRRFHRNCPQGTSNSTGSELNSSSVSSSSCKPAFFLFFQPVLVIPSLVAEARKQQVILAFNPLPPNSWAKLCVKVAIHTSPTLTAFLTAGTLNPSPCPYLCLVLSTLSRTIFYK